MMQGITEMKCGVIFDWVKDHFSERLAFPTHRQMVEAGLVSSTSQAGLRIKQMYDLGWLERERAGTTWKYRIKGAKVVFTDPLDTSQGGDPIYGI